MFIDPHTHSAGASRCSHITIEDLIDFKINLGYGGIIVTNHVQPWYYSDRGFNYVIDDIEREFENGLKHLERKGEKQFKLLLGAEVSIDLPRYSDILIYGDVLPFLKKHPRTCTATQQELFEYCEEDGLAMIQAHPRREGMDFLDPKFLHGVELNCQQRDINTHPDVIKFATEHNLKLTCGTDIHSTDIKVLGGMIIPDNITDCSDFAAYLKTTDFTQIKINEKELIHRIK